MNCDDCRELFYEYLDNELDDMVRQRVERHLAECRVCRTEWQEIRESLASYRNFVMTVSPGHDLTEYVLTNLSGWERRQATVSFLFLGAAFMGILMFVGMCILLPLVYPILRVGLDLAINNLLPIPAIMLMAFPAAKTASLILLGLALLLMTWATRRAILY